MVFKICGGGGIFSLVPVYCNCEVLLLPATTAGGALEPSKWELHLGSSSKVRIPIFNPLWLGQGYFSFE